MLRQDPHQITYCNVGIPVPLDQCAVLLAHSTQIPASKVLRPHDAPIPRYRPRILRDGQRAAVGHGLPAIAAFGVGGDDASEDGEGASCGRDETGSELLKVVQAVAAGVPMSQLRSPAS